MTDLEQYQPIQGEIVSRRDMRNATTDSWTDVLEDVGDLANRIAGTDFVPDGFKGSVPAVAATILHGREIGFAPMTALASLHSIKGKVGLSAEAMRALVLQAGHTIEFVESTTARCVARGRRAGSDSWTQIAWSTDDAKKAGLLNGSGWRNYPRQMLQARASSELCRLLFPDVIRGLASVEELEQYDVISPTGEIAPSGEKKPVKRAARKKAEPAEAPAPPLPEDEATPQTAAGSDQGKSGAGEAPTDATDPAAPQTGEEAVERETSDASSPPLPEDEPSPSAPQDDAAPDASAGSDDDGSPADPSEPALPDDGDDDVVEAEIVEDEVEAEPRMTVEQRPALMAAFSKLDIKDKAERMQVTIDLIGRTVTSANELSVREASSVIDTLKRCEDRDDLEGVIQATVAHREGGES